jgi:crotonobetainyl-CoA:carnitine CoA-transferase CaiB-like acyl-CoA transferase
MQLSPHGDRGDEMRALSHLRIVEIGSTAAASYCARMFADFGATTFKVEPPSGDPLRRAGPLTSAGSSAWFAFLNTNKSSIVLDGDDTGSASRLADLLRDCDVLLDGRGLDPCGCPNLDLVAVQRDNPGLVHIDMSWFGGDGPYRDYAMSDVVCRALAGLNKLAGPAEGPPISMPDFQTGIVGGLWAYIAASSALISRTIDGRGRSIQLSLFEACIAIGEYLMFESWSKGDAIQRLGINRFWPTLPVGIYETAEGWLGVTTVTQAQWMAFCDMLGLDDLRDDTTLVTGLDRLPRMRELEDRFVPQLKTRTARDWFAEGLKRRIPIVPVPSIDEIVHSPERNAQGTIVPVAFGDEAAVMPGSMLRLRSTPPRAGGRVPEIGEMQGGDTPTAMPHLPPKPFSASPAAQRQMPLAGLRVVDFSMGWAGPLCSRTLADLGADVIKIEALQYPDWWRGVDRRAAYLIEKQYEKVPRFSMMNRNKRGITLDLTRPAGVDLAKQLIRDADAVIDNYSVDVLLKLGLGYDALSRIKPSLVVMSMSAFGTQSAYRDCRAYGSTLEQGSGLPQVVGEAGGPPIMQHTAFGDPVGGLNGAAAVLTALLHARRTGQGQFIDLSQIDCMVPFAAPWIIVHSADGREPIRYGQGHPDHAPHGCFPCAEPNSWLMVAVTSDAMWMELAKLLGRKDLTGDLQLATVDGRQRRAGDIAAAIVQWTSTKPAETAMQVMQHAGIAAGVLRAPVDMLGDPQLKARGFLQSVDRPYIGSHPEPSLPFREADQPYPIRFAAPTLGQHNEEILCGELGLSRVDYDALKRDGIIGNEIPLPVEAAVNKAAQ